MASNHGKMRMHADGDRLSSLPDELIHKILSFLNMEEAIETSVLSSRWRFVWTSMPYLKFSSEGFSTLRKFSEFVRGVMSRLKTRNNLTNVYSVKLSFCGKVSQPCIKKTLDHVLSHNIQKLDVEGLRKNHAEFPLCHFRSQSLKHLSVKMKNSYLTSSLELPGLTTLDLRSVTLCYDNPDTCIGDFSKCANLENLTLNYFGAKGSNSFSISHPRLSNLTLKDNYNSVKVVNVAAPQLKNLTIIDYDAKLVISAPNLASLLCKGSSPLQLSTEGFPSLEKANICFRYPGDADAQEIVCLLQQLHSVKFLTLNLEIVELLSLSVGLFLNQTSPFLNLKSLNIYPHKLYVGEQPPEKVAAELKSYLLDSSPGCIFTMVSREETRAQKLMTELQVLLVEGIDSANRTLKSHKSKMKMNGGNVPQIKSLGVQIERRKKKASRIISTLKDIERSLKKLHVSRRGKIQPCFSSLCAEADVAISKITECMKILCDEYQSRSSVLFHELAATSVNPSS